MHPPNVSRTESGVHWPVTIAPSIMDSRPDRASKVGRINCERIECTKVCVYSNTLEADTGGKEPDKTFARHGVSYVWCRIIRSRSECGTHSHSLGGQVTECQTAVVRTVHSTVQYLSHRGGRILDSDAI